MGCLLSLHRSVSSFEDLDGETGNVRFHLRVRSLKTQNEKQKEDEMGTRASSDRLRAMRSCALVRLEGDAAALKARPLRVWQIVMLSKRKREVAVAEFFDFGLVQSGHQSSPTATLLASSGPSPESGGTYCPEPVPKITAPNKKLQNGKNERKNKNCMNKNCTTIKHFENMFEKTSSHTRKTCVVASFGHSKIFWKVRESLFVQLHRISSTKHFDQRGFGQN